jgi:hypothetical protein
MEIIENFLPKPYHDKLYSVLMGQTFPWFYNHGTAYLNDDGGSKLDSNTLDVKQFTHAFYKENQYSNYYNLIHPIIILLEQKFDREFESRLIRAKANLMIKHSNYPKDFYTIPHKDHLGEIESFLYYVNDSDGDTLIFNEKDRESTLTVNSRISPVHGKSVLFDSSYFHSSTPPTEHNERVVLNFVFKR